MMMPSASMSSSTVMKTKMKAALRTRAAPPVGDTPGAASALSGFASGIGIFLLAQRQPDRRARQVEGLAQAVDEIAAVDLGHRVGAAEEQHEARRAAFWLPPGVGAG